MPVTARRPVDLGVTEAATFRVDADGLELIDPAEDVTLDWVSAHTQASFGVAAA